MQPNLLLKYHKNLSGGSTTAEGYFTKYHHTFLEHDPLSLASYILSDKIGVISHYKHPLPHVKTKKNGYTKQKYIANDVDDSKVIQTSYTRLSLLPYIKDGLSDNFQIPFENVFTNYTDNLISVENNQNYELLQGILVEGFAQTKDTGNQYSKPDFIFDKSYVYICRPKNHQEDTVELYINTDLNEINPSKNSIQIFINKDYSNDFCDLYQLISSLSLYDTVVLNNQLFKEHFKETALSMIKTSTNDEFLERLLSLMGYHGQEEFRLVDYDYLNQVQNALKSVNKNKDYYYENNPMLNLVTKINTLNTIKSNLIKPTQNQDVLDKWSETTDYSEQQKEIIKSLEPLTVIQAGAGTGKSTTIGGRIEFLKDLSVKLDEIMVVSFTNAAANTITERFKGVKASTLATFTKNFYDATFTNQPFVSDETFINTLAMVDPYSPNLNHIKMNPRERMELIHEFGNRLKDLRAAEENNQQISIATARLTSFIHKHLDPILTITYLMKMTTLNIQKIFMTAYLSSRIQDVKIPNEYKQLKYIIADESQDIATDEYILLFLYTKLYKANLMLVGDGAQTLYEWRQSDPEFLNTIIESSVFTTYDLSTNYRSNQSILNHANLYLNDIQSSSLQLVSYNPTNSLKTVGLKLTEVKHTNMDIQVDDTNAFHNAAFDYIKKSIENDEQLAILSWKSFNLKVIQNYMNTLEKSDLITHPDDKKLNITQLNNQDLTTPSIWTTSYLESKDKLPKPNHPKYEELMRSHLTNSASQIKGSVYQKRKYVERMNKSLDSFFKTIDPHLKVKSMDLTNEQQTSLYDRNLKRFLVEEEKEAFNQDVLKNKTRKLQTVDDADVVFSTIHAAKGYEFDNTLIILEKRDFDISKRSEKELQAYLRLLYVAFTRAKKSCMILQLDPDPKVKDNLIVDNYMTYLDNEN